MADRDMGKLLGAELGRVLEEYRRVGAEMDRLAADRRRLAAIAQRVSRILRLQVGGPAAGRLIAELGLEQALAALPGLPGRKPSDKPERAPRQPRATRSARRAAPKSRGKAASRRTAAPAVPSAAPADIVAKGTPVRMRSGIYQDWTGIVRWMRIQGSKVTYTLGLKGPDGRPARTQVGHASLGKSWELTGRPAADQAEAATAKPQGAGPGRKVRRRNGAKPVNIAAPAPKAEKARETTPAAVVEKTAGKGAAGAAAPAAGPLPKGTPIRMLAGIYSGYAGTVASVQSKAGSRGVDAIYTLSLVSPEGKRARTSVKQSSYGRSWTYRK